MDLVSIMMIGIVNLLDGLKICFHIGEHLLEVEEKVEDTCRVSHCFDKLADL